MWIGQTDTSTGRRAGLGFAQAPNVLNLPTMPTIPWRDLIIWSLVAILLYQLFFSRRARARRERMKEAREKYRREIARIKAI